MATVYKRGSTWWGRFQHQGVEHRQSLATRNRAVAERRLREWIERCEDEQFGARPRRTVDELGESFILEHMAGLSRGGQLRYVASIKQLLPHFGALHLDEVNGATLAAFEAARRKGGVSSPTIRRDLACLSSMFTHAVVDLEWIDVNPVRLYMSRQQRRGRLREAPPRTRYLTHDEEARLLDAAAASANIRLADMIAFAIDTGLRREEQLSLTWDQVNLKRSEVTVWKTKSGHARSVPLLGRSAQLSAQLPRHIRSPFVFTKPDGERFIRPEKSFHNALERAGLKDVRWHDLRRTCGCRLLQDHRMPIAEVSRWLGHQSIGLTQRAYAFLDIASLHRGVGTKTGTGAVD